MSSSFMVRRRPTAAVAMVVALIPVLLTASTTTVSANQPAVIGVAKVGGKVMGKTIISAYPHNRKKNVSRVAWARTGSNGKFALHIKRTSSLAKAAQSHGGLVSLDLAITKSGKLYMRAVRVHYSATTKLGSVPLRRVSYTTPAKANATSQQSVPNIPPTMGSVAIFGATLMVVNHATDEYTHYEYRGNSASSVGVGFGTTVQNFTASGSATISGDNGGGFSGDFGKKSHKNAAIKLEIPVSVSVTPHCIGVFNDYGVRVSTACVYETQAQWNATVHESAAKHLGCESSSVSHAFWFTRKDHTKTFFKTSGKAFKVVAKAAIAGGSAEVDTAFSKNVMEFYHFGLPKVAGYYYCLGGTNGTWVTASRVAVTTLKKGGGTAPCYEVGQEVTWASGEKPLMHVC